MILQNETLKDFRSIGKINWLYNEWREKRKMENCFTVFTEGCEFPCLRRLKQSN